MSKPAILLVANYSNRTGYAWRNIYRLFSVIANKMHDKGISVCLSFAKLEPPVEFIDKNVPVNCFEFDPFNLTLPALYSLWHAIRKYQIKYVYFTDNSSFRLFYLFLRLTGVRKIIVHSRVSVANPYPAIAETGARRVVKTAIGKINWVLPDRIYAVSNFVRNRLVYKNCLPQEKVIKILNGINIEVFKCKNKHETDKQILIFIGARATKNKGVDVLIKAADILLNKYGINEFIIEYAGEGPDIESLMRLVEEKNLQQHFRFLGQLKNTLDAICKADIVVVPSVWGDACPSSVSEALAAGRPLITTLAGGIPEIVGSNDNAVMLPPADYLKLAETLARLIRSKEERDALGENARARAELALDENNYYDTVIRQLIIDLAI
jgi:glycosyltransferase involved in cell wall biosynthesis